MCDQRIFLMRGALIHTSETIIGAHVLMYTENPEADHAFFRHILGFPSVDAGHGWLIRRSELAADYSVNTTDCTPETSKRLRQRGFLHTTRSSLRSM